MTVYAGAASAEDGKAMPGAACQATFASGVQALFRGGPFVSSSGSGTVSVTCPVTKDIENGRITRAEVMVIDRNGSPGADISCTLATFNRDGTVRHSDVRRSNSSFNTPLALIFPAQAAAAKGSHSLVCELPAMSSVGPSSIAMYNVVEE